MRAILILLSLGILLALGAVVTSSLLGIWGFGPTLTLPRVVVHKAVLFEGRYLVHTSKGLFEIDSLPRDGVSDPEELFASLQADHAYALTTVGTRRTLLGHQFLPYIVAVQASPTGLPANFLQILREAGYDSIPKTPLWVNWEKQSLLHIEGDHYTVLVGPVPPGLAVTPPTPPLAPPAPQRVLKGDL